MHFRRSDAFIISVKYKKYKNMWYIVNETTLHQRPNDTI